MYYVLGFLGSNKAPILDKAKQENWARGKDPRIPLTQFGIPLYMKHSLLLLEI